MADVYVSVGSNIEPELNISNAIKALQKHFGELRISTTYENPALGFDGPPFHNLVIGLQTQLQPIDLMGVLRGIETQHGRPALSQPFTSRTLDIDLLLYDQWIYYDHLLEIPHHDILRYPFVLCPLAEIAGELTHPLLQISIEELWRGFSKEKVVLKPVHVARISVVQDSFSF